jgi:hypothetical protein
VGRKEIHDKIILHGEFHQGEHEDNETYGEEYSKGSDDYAVILKKYGMHRKKDV